MKIFISIMILCFLTVLPLAAGGGQQAAPRGPAADSASVVNPAGQLPVVNRPISLTIGIAQDPVIPDYKNAHFTRYMEQHTGIDLDFHLFAPGADGNTQFELMIASNERLPDLRFGAPANWRILGDTGVFIEMTPLYERYAHFYHERIIQENLDESVIRQRTTAPSGGRYAWPTVQAQGVNEFYGQNFINFKWLEALGLRMPTTTEEFLNTMIAFRDRDPNGNGQRDEIPWLASTVVWSAQPVQFLMNAFLYYPYENSFESNLAITNGRIWAPWVTDEYREGLRYINRLHNEGIFLSSFFTMTRPEMEAVVSFQPGETNRVGFVSAGPTQPFVPETPAIYDYTTQVSLTGPRGVNYYPKIPSSNINPGVFITRDCQYPEAAFRWLDFLASREASMTMRFGELNVDWRWTTPADNLIDAAIQQPAMLLEINVIGGVTNTKHWNTSTGTFFIFRGNTEGRARQSGGWIGDRWDLFDNRFINDGKDLPEKAIAIDYTQEELDAIMEIRTTITSYHRECLALFITGEMNIDRDWNGYLQNLQRMGLDRYLSIAQTAYTRMMSR